MSESFFNDVAGLHLFYRTPPVAHSGPIRKALPSNSLQDESRKKNLQIILISCVRKHSHYHHHKHKYLKIWMESHT